MSWATSSDRPTRFFSRWAAFYKAGWRPGPAASDSPAPRGCAKLDVKDRTTVQLRPEFRFDHAWDQPGLGHRMSLFISDWKLQASPEICSCLDIPR